MASVLALRGGTPVRSGAFHGWPIHDDLERKNLLEVLESGVWSFNGPKEAEFAEQFAEFCGVAHVFCVANGSVSLEIALRALRIGPGDEVIVPALTWTATAWAVVQVGAVPVFADICDNDWCIDPRDAARKISTRTRAIVPVHLYNQIAEMDEILALARKHSLFVIEDCAHTHGSRWGDLGIGTLGNVGSFSFQQTKGMTSGEGGAITTNDGELADRIYGLKNCGRPVRPGAPGTFGSNYRITELQAAILLSQLKRLPTQLEIKARNFTYFRRKMASVPGVTILPPKNKATRQGLYAVSVSMDTKAFSGVPREVLISALQSEGIPVMSPYEVVYGSALWVNGANFIRFPEGVDASHVLGLGSNCPVAEAVSRERGLTIPHQVFLGTEQDMDDLVAAFAKVQEHSKDLRMMGFEKKVRSAASSVLRSIGIR